MEAKTRVVAIRLTRELCRPTSIASSTKLKNSDANFTRSNSKVSIFDFSVSVVVQYFLLENGLKYFDGCVASLRKRGFKIGFMSYSVAVVVFVENFFFKFVGTPEAMAKIEKLVGKQKKSGGKRKSKERGGEKEPGPDLVELSQVKSAISRF